MSPHLPQQLGLGDGVSIRGNIDKISTRVKSPHELQETLLITLEDVWQRCDSKIGPLASLGFLAGGDGLRVSHHFIVQDSPRKSVTRWQRQIAVRPPTHSLQPPIENLTPVHTGEVAIAIDIERTRFAFDVFIA